MKQQSQQQSFASWYQNVLYLSMILALIGMNYVCKAMTLHSRHYTLLAIITIGGSAIVYITSNQLYAWHRGRTSVFDLFKKRNSSR
jgi:hypothetical protein